MACLVSPEPDDEEPELVPDDDEPLDVDPLPDGVRVAPAGCDEVVAAGSRW